MDISNPRRILAVSLSDSENHLRRFVKDITGTAPESASTSLAGTTHDLELKTAYYRATVPIWLDLISEPSEWSGSFLSPEAKEVLNVLGGVVVVFSLPTKPDSDEALAVKDLIQHVGIVVKDGLGGWSWDGVGLCMGVGELDDVDEWDDCAAQNGMEFVQVKAKMSEDRNEFGEKTGIPRAREALEANDWAQLDDDLDSDFGDFETSLDEDHEDGNTIVPGAKDTDIDPESLHFGFDRADFEGLKRAIFSSDQNEEEEVMNVEPTEKSNPSEDQETGTSLDDSEIQKLEGMMQKLQAVRDISAGLPEDQRKRMAARAVNEVMKDL